MMGLGMLSRTGSTLASVLPGKRAGQTRLSATAEVYIEANPKVTSASTNSHR